MLLTQPDNFSTAHRTIKNNQLFLVDDIQGNIVYKNQSGLGLYFLDTRFLSCYEIRLNQTLPVTLLSSTENGYLSTIVYTNGQIETLLDDGGKHIFPEMSLQLKRDTLLHESMLEKFTLRNFYLEPQTIQVSFRINADFRDIFEVRHLFPSIRGKLLPPVLSDKNVILAYEEPSGDTLRTVVSFKDFKPSLLHQQEDGVTFAYETRLNPLEEKVFHLEIQCDTPCQRVAADEPDFNPVNEIPPWRGIGGDFTVQAVHSRIYDEGLKKTDEFNGQWRRQATSIVTDNDDLNDMIERSSRDLRMLMTQIPRASMNEANQTKLFEQHAYIAAGIPWYVALFGRDSIITARDCLFLNPELAKSVLRTLAFYQGKTYNDWKDEEPGKILHELRLGELARLNEIPHTPYYGSVDATPLWIILLYDYYLWTRDMETLQALWPNALAAMDWIDQNLKDSPNGYLTYFQKSPKGLYHQGWKDSHDSAMYEDGVQAKPPLALVEVQGYVYLAKKRMSRLADILADMPENTLLAAQLRAECKEFKRRFNQDFWMPEKGFCPIGLDASGRPLGVISSNPGHCLETGILTQPRAAKVASRLMESDMFNGWGIRTLSEKNLAYNPMSYHNGSVWPHDNAMIARGLVAIGRSDLAEKVFTGIYEAGRLMFYKRIPELFCGFPRSQANAGDPPVKYPVACSPQAWAASSVYSFIQSLLNISPQWASDTLILKQPTLPQGVNHMRVKNLRIGDNLLDLKFNRSENNVLLEVLNRKRKMAILVEK